MNNVTRDLRHTGSTRSRYQLLVDLLQLKFGFLELRNVLADTKSAKYISKLVLQRHLRADNPCFTSIRLDFFFTNTDERFSGLHNATFALEEALCTIEVPKIEVGASNDTVEVTSPKQIDHAVADADKSRVKVLEVDVVLCRPHQRIH